MNAPSLAAAADRRRLLHDLALTVRERVVPELGSFAGRPFAGDGAGGEITFAVDEVAEGALVEFLSERAPRIAYYSEDRGWRPRTRLTCWSSTRSTAHGRRPRGSSRHAWRWHWHRSVTASL
jgi:hypothetical protein